MRLLGDWDGIENYRSPSCGAAKKNLLINGTGHLK
jgi:hypothetical protein